MKNFLREISNEDLIAKEAMYHNTCRRAYTRKVAQTSEEAETGRSEQQETHTKSLCFYLQLCGFSN